MAGFGGDNGTAEDDGDDEAAFDDDSHGAIEPLDDLLDGPAVTLDVPSYSGAMTRLLDFDPESDGIEIEYHPQYDAATGDEIMPTIDVVYSGEANATAVIFNGEPWVELPGEVNMSAEDVILTPLAVAA